MRNLVIVLFLLILFACKQEPYRLYNHQNFHITDTIEGNIWELVYSPPVEITDTPTVYVKKNKVTTDSLRVYPLEAPSDFWYISPWFSLGPKIFTVVYICKRSKYDTEAELPEINRREGLYIGFSNTGSYLELYDINCSPSDTTCIDTAYVPKIPMSKLVITEPFRKKYLPAK
jgi:hypothetical protein